MAKLPHQSSVPPVDPQDGAIKSDGGAADSLQTTTTDVVVSSAAAPSTGDVLTAIDGVSADWQAPVAGGAGSDTTAIHDDTAGEISVVAEKATPIGADVLLIEDSADSNNKKRVQIANLPGGSDPSAIHDDVAGEINAVALKATPVAADVILIEDSAAGFAKKSTTLTDLLGGGGGSGPIAAAQGAFIRASLSAVITDPVLNDAVVWDVEHGNGGSDRITYNNTNGQVTVKAGTTALLMGQVHLVHTAAYLQEWGWYDVTGAAEVLGSRQENRSTTAGAHRSSTTISAATVRPTVDSVYELRLLNPSTAGVDVHNAGTWLQAIEIGAVQADVVGGLEFMDIIDVTTTETTRTFGASGHGAFGRALDGDIDDTYIIEAYFPDPVVAAGFELQPNGLGTNQEGTRHFAGSSTGFAVTTALSLGVAPLNGLINGCRVEFHAKSGKQRVFFCDQFQSNGAGTRHSIQNHGVWTDTAVNVTSLDIISTVASGIRSGARFVLWRRTASNLRSDSAAVYERMSMETVDPGALVTTERTVGHAIYGGSIVGVSARVEDAVTAGSITVNVKAGGVTKLTAVLDATNSTSRVARAAIGQQTFAADENISVEFVPSAYDNAGSIASAVTVQVHMTNDALITQNDRVVASTVLGANATTLSVTGLNGDLDGTYEIEGTIFLTALANNLFIAPNGDTLNLKSGQSPNGTFASSSDGKIVNSSAVSTRNEFNFRCLAYVSRTKNGVTRIRSFQFTASHTFDAATNINTHISNVAYEDGAANLTGLDFTCSVASGILAGSEVIVRRVKA